MTRLQDVRRLEDEFAEAMQRLYTIGNGLARLRAELDREAAPPVGAPVASPVTAPAPGPMAAPTPGPAIAPSAAPVGAPGPIPVPAQGPLPAPGSPVLPPPPSAMPGTPAQSAPRWWQREGAVIKVLVIAGAIVTLVGVVMLLALAIQKGWFGPPARVIGGGLLAAGLILAGHLTRSRESRSGHKTAGPVVMAATGFAAAYLDIVAATTVYGFAPPVVGLVLAAVVAGAGLTVAWRWDAELLAVVTVLGAAVLGPVVTGEPGWVVSAFVVILTAAGVPVQLSHRWPVLDAARTLPAALVILAGLVATTTGTADHWVQIGLAAGLATLAVVTAVGRPGASTEHGTTGASVVSTSLVGVAAVPLLFSVTLFDTPGQTVGLALVAAAYLALTVLGGRGRIVPMSMGLRATLGSAGTLALVIAVVTGAPERHIPTGLILAAATYLSLAAATRSRFTLALGTAVTTLAAFAYLPHAVAATSSVLARDAGPGVMLVDSLLVLGLLALAGWLVAAGALLPTSVRPLAIAALWVGGLAVTATTAVSAGMFIGQQLDEAQAGFLAGHAVATLAWMGAAAWLLGRGLKRAKDAGLALRVGLVLAAVSVGKLVLFDLAALQGLWRVGAFIGTGVLLLTAGSSYARALDRSRAAARPAH